MKKLIIATILVVRSAHAQPDAIQRLDEHIAHLQHLYSQHRTNQREIVRSDSWYAASSGMFKHDSVVSCIGAIQKESSLNPFFGMWHQEKASENELFVQECALLNVLFYGNMLHAINQHERIAISEDITVDQIIMLYERLATMPLVQLLQLLDVIADKVTDFVQTNPVGQTLFAWIGTQWWEPMVVLGSHIVQWCIHSIFGARFLL